MFRRFYRASFNGYPGFWVHHGNWLPITGLSLEHNVVITESFGSSTSCQLASLGIFVLTMVFSTPSHCFVFS